jgi:FkbM family methyltransferase
MDSEEYVKAGQALIQLGRWLQKCHPTPERAGSQFDEDKILAGLLPGQKGIYVDVGANHSSECSNTWQFYKRGWRGLLIEPFPDSWQDLLINRREDRLCPLAASNEEGFASLRSCRSVSSLRSDWRIDDVGVIPTRTAALKTILNSYKDHDWRKTDLCSIDVEGYEKEVLEGIDWNAFRPKVFVIEYREYDEKGVGRDSSGNWLSILQDQRYNLVHQNSLNQIWQRK